MNELIKVEAKNNQQVVSARDLYNGLEIAQRFSRWVDNNFEMFEEGIDFYKCTSSTVVNNSGKPKIKLTTRVTGKGQNYFVNKFLKDNKKVEA